jgi:hypothetical protein
MCVADTTATSAIAADSRKERLYLGDIKNILKKGVGGGVSKHALDQAQRGAAADGGGEGQEHEGCFGDGGVGARYFLHERHVTRLQLCHNRWKKTHCITEHPYENMSLPAAF